MIVFIPYPPRKYCVSSTVRLVFKALFHIVNSSNAVFGRMWSSGSPFRTRHPIEIKGTYYNKFIWEGVLQPRILWKEYVCNESEKEPITINSFEKVSCNREYILILWKEYVCNESENEYLVCIWCTLGGKRCINRCSFLHLPFVTIRPWYWQNGVSDLFTHHIKLL